MPAGSPPPPGEAGGAAAAGIRVPPLPTGRRPGSRVLSADLRVAGLGASWPGDSPAPSLYPGEGGSLASPRVWVWVWVGPQVLCGFWLAQSGCLGFLSPVSVGCPFPGPSAREGAQAFVAVCFVSCFVCFVSCFVGALVFPACRLHFQDWGSRARGKPRELASILLFLGFRGP